MQQYFVEVQKSREERKRIFLAVKIYSEQPMTQTKNWSQSNTQTDGKEQKDTQIMIGSNEGVGTWIR